MFKMLSWRKITILCHASAAWRAPGVIFFPEYTINQMYLGLAGFFFSAFLRDIHDSGAQYSKVAIFALSQSEHSLYSGKKFPVRSDRQRSGFCGCSRLPFTAKMQLGCNLSSNAQQEKDIQLISMLFNLRFWSHLGFSFSLPITHTWQTLKFKFFD